jgi:hypothetical protein
MGGHSFGGLFPAGMQVLRLLYLFPVRISNDALLSVEAVFLLRCLKRSLFLDGKTAGEKYLLTEGGIYYKLMQNSTLFRKSEGGMHRTKSSAGSSSKDDNLLQAVTNMEQSDVSLIITPYLLQLPLCCSYELLNIIPRNF